MYAASGRKTEYRRRRARRASALMVVLALLFTMVPTGFATVAGAAEAAEAAPPEPIPEPIPEPTPEPPADDPTDDTTDDPTDDPTNDISDDPADDITDRAAPTATAVTVTCYVAVDGNWKQVGTVQTDKIDSGRFYIMAAELDGIYGEYGFSSANYSGELFFPHTDNNSIDKLWADAVPQQNTDGAWQIPLSTRGPIYLYYLPGNTAGSPGYFDSSKSKTDAEMLAANMFYTVQVEDPTHAVYDTPPAPQVLFHGEGTTVTLNKAEGVTWTAVNGQTGATLSLAMTETEPAVTYTIDNINAPIRFRPRVAAGMLRYEAMPDGWMSKLGNFGTSRQQAQQTATVRGEAVFMALPAENSHTLLPPDIDRIAVTITDANNHTMFYSFAGWKVVSAADSPVLPAGTVLTAEDLNRYAGSDGVIRLQAVWSGVDSERRPNTVHFFLHKNGELKGSVEDGVKPESPDDYTPAIYSTRMMNAGEIPTTYTTGGTPLVARPNADADAYQTDITIRDMVRTPVRGATLEDLPGDETVFAYLRANHIQMQINGQVVENDKLNTTYFGIRWNTVKYESSDGWHIDGVLVAKRARFIVTKTFAGDAAAIALAKENFTITVSHTEGSGSVTDFTLLPQPAADVNEAGKLGYTDYDAATQTYTWEVPAQQKRSYTITEAGYIPSGNWRVSNSYAIRNAPEGDPTGYQTYPKDGIVIKAVGYADDVQNIAVQTVALRNVYVGVGTLTVNTQDAITGDNLRDIPYRLTRDGSAVTLYRRPGTTLYSMINDPDYTETISDGTMTAGANGLFTIRLETGTYTLTETLPTGYYGPGTVQVTVAKDASGGMTYRSVAQNLPTEVTTPTGGWLKEAETDHITILNVPRMLISVTARSSWPENGEKLPVTVQLWCDGTPVPGDQYTQVLSEENKWEYTWNNLPLFTNGTVAGYTLRVTKIGNTYRDAALGDGFADYDVTNDDVKYRKTGDSAYRNEHMWEEDGVQHFAQEALLVVRNEGVRGAVTFTKADEMNRPLQGAEFTLYTDAACTHPLATAPSDANGRVEFTPQPGGTYYLKETKAPQGHTAEDTVWMVKIAGGKATITTPTGAVVTSVRNTSLLQLTLRVLGPEGESLPDTQLRVTWDKVQHPEYTTNTNGTVLLTALPNGNYTVRLMNTPTGYLPPVSDPTLQAQYGEITLTSGDDAWTLEKTAEGYRLTLRLQALYTLPTTGGTGTAAFTAAGVLLMGLAAVMLCRKKQVE